MKKIFALSIALVLTTAGCKKAPADSGHRSTDKTVKVSRTLGQLSIIALSRPDDYRCFIGVVDRIVSIPLSDGLGSENFVNLTHVADYCAAGREVFRSTVASLDITIGVGGGGNLVGTSGLEIAHGSRITFLASATMASKTLETQQGRQDFTYFQPITPLFDEDAQGFVAIKGENTWLKIVENLRIPFDSIKDIAWNSMAGSMQRHGDVCNDEQCSISCADVGGDVPVGIDSCTVQSCVYRVVCGEAETLSEPDPCTECGDTVEAGSIIRREINGVEVCWDAATMEQIDCS